MKNNAKDLAIELENVISKIKDGYEDAIREESRLDLLRQDILHHIENNIFNASQGYKYTKALQIIAKERRVVKQQIATLQCLNKRLEPMKKNILKTTERAIGVHREKEKLIHGGDDSYKPRVIKSINKNDILNQVVDILNSED